tara:strand:+ start:2055 stop:2738 length:684 start_codon:yes stop_codon:yes gene_type:complete
MSFFNQILLARNIQGNVESVIGRSKQRLVVTFPPIKFVGFGGSITYTPKQTTVFDIMEYFTYRSSVRITENPVEQGVNINDHRIQQPRELEIKVGTSNIIDPVTALTLLDSASIIQAIALQIVGNRIANGRIQATYAQLQNAKDNSQVFDIDTPMGLMQNLVITDVESTNDAESITTFEGVIKMREILFFDNVKNSDTKVSGINARDIVLRPILSPLKFLTPGEFIL